MFLGAMLDVGLDIERLRTALASIPVGGYQLLAEPCVDHAIAGTRARVVLSEQVQPARRLADINALLHASALAHDVRENALAIFACLARSEAAVHATSIEEVHFHEVGAIDAIIDISAAAFAVAELGISRLYASALPLTSGHVLTAHGQLPVPAPATLEILRRVGAPWKPAPVEGELVTPTGAAILATLARFETPALVIERVGYGFGQKRMPWPNCLRLCLGEAYAVPAADEDLDSDWVAVIECNIDNMAGELLGGLMESLFSAGALDVSYTPVQMKKNRPAVMVSVICRPDQERPLAAMLLRESATLGVRVQEVQRLKAQRASQQIVTPLGVMNVKVKRLGARVISAAPEYEECRRIAREEKLPLQEVYRIAQDSIAADILQQSS
jgi:pyridinium-3,5-bisthiocarboxylic acid mononucleotide nickel chelatase